MLSSGNELLTSSAVRQRLAHDHFRPARSGAGPKTRRDSPLLSYRAGVMLTHARFCNGYVYVDSLMSGLSLGARVGTGSRAEGVDESSS